MQLVIERDGQTWCFNVMMGMETLTVTLRAWYDGPLPDVERSFGESAGVELPARYWRGGSGTVGTDAIPRPGWLKDAVHDAIKAATFMRGF